VKAETLIDDTACRYAPVPLAPRREHSNCTIKYHYTISGVWGGRTRGHVEAGRDLRHGAMVPRMCVYDDLRAGTAALHRRRVLPGIRQVRLLRHVPSNMIVAGSGELMIERCTDADTVGALRQAKNSDKTVVIRSAAKSTTLPAGQAAVAHSPALPHGFNARRGLECEPVFVWDAARINLPTAKPVSPRACIRLRAWGTEHGRAPLIRERYRRALF